MKLLRRSSADCAGLRLSSSKGRRPSGCPGRLAVGALLAFALLLPAPSGAQGNYTVFDQTFTHRQSTPRTVKAGAPGEFVLRVEGDGVASAQVILNGVTVLRPADVTTTVVERTVTLKASNSLTVKVQRPPSGQDAVLRVLFIGVDAVPPAISALPTRSPDSNGWYRSDVAVKFRCTDVASGLATCPGQRVVQAEGRDQVISGTAADRAGNTASASATVSVDTTAPVIQGTLAPPPNAAGWHRDEVKAYFTCEDALSGVAECTDRRQVRTDGANQAMPGTARDRAGNKSSISLSVNVDTTPPAITATIEPPADATGWHRVRPTVRFACEDGLSGIAQCSDPVTVQSHGAGIVVTGKTVDRAGNTAVARVTLNVREPTEPPTITAQMAPEPTAAGWHNGDVVVTFTCTAGDAPIVACPEPRTITAEGQHQVTAGVADTAGQTASVSVAVRIDRTPPPIVATLNPAPNERGWNTTPVTVTFTCEDALSPVTSCPEPVTVGGEGADQVVMGEAVDAAGNRSHVSATLNVDTTPPTIAAAAPPPNAAGWHREALVVSFVCSDALSQLAECAAPVNVSADVTGQTVSGTATDRAGNTATASVVVNLDQTPPEVRALVSTPGVVNSDVTVAFDCSDVTSGVDVCPTPQVVAQEGLDQAVSGTAVDRAGNSATATASVSLDRTAPSIVATLNPAPNERGWNNTTVTVAFTCEDALSPIASCPAPITVSTEGAGQVFGGEAADAAGNRSQASATLNIDATPPAIAAASSPAATASGWNNSPVVVSFTAIDALSGVAPDSLTAPVMLAADGLDQAATGQATDLAGNVASFTQSGINIDRGAPVISVALSPAPNGSGWSREAVTARFTCSDAVSGVANCATDQVIATEGTPQTVTGSVTDQAGNTSTVTSDSFRIDLVAPVISVELTPPANGGGWHNGPVTARFTCSDDGSGVTSCPPDQVIATEGASQTVTGEATDAAGHRAQATATVSIDTTAPTIAALPSPPANAHGWNNSPVTVAFDCRDDGSQIATCGEAVHLTTDGERSATGTATDRAGNGASVSVPIRIDQIAPAIDRVLQPAANASGWNNTDVAVSYTCADTLSGVASCPAQQAFTSEGANQRIGAEATDLAGNTATIESAVSIDKTPPDVTAASAPPPNTRGWNTTPVTVSFTCVDGLSDVASCAQPVVVSAEGARQAVTGTAVDRAGNSASVNVDVSLDGTAPAIVASAAPPANAAGWHGGPVTVSFSCDDSLGEIASCPAPVIVSSEGRNQVVSGEAIDSAGNTASTSLSLDLDLTPPAIAAAVSPAPNAAGWNRQPAIVTFTCADALSEIASCTGPTTMQEGNAQPAPGTAIDRAGNTAHASVVVNVDTTPPVITAASSPPPNAMGWNRTDVTVRYDCTDGGSGIDACPDSIAVTADGSETFSRTATDRAGNTATASARVDLDRTAPDVTIADPPDGSVVRISPARITGTFADNLSGIASAVCGAAPLPGVAPFVCELVLAAGANTITVRVTDAAGNEATVGRTFSFEGNRPPHAIAGGPYQGVALAPIAFNGARSTDPDRNTLTYAWAFGDGTAGTGAHVEHSYTEPGTYAATLTVDDGNSGTHAATAEVTVARKNVAPVAMVGGPYTGEAGRAVAFDARASSDPDGDALSYAWTFGDSGAGTGAAPSHAYSEDGVYPVTVTVSDGHGGSSSASTQVTVRATNEAPAAAANGPYAREAGLAVGFSSSGSQDPDGDVLTFRWQFGDGLSNTGASPSHVYQSAGTYTAQLTVDDGRGGIASDTAIVTISPPATTENRNPIANAGGPYEAEAGVPITLDGTASDPDGDGLTYAWTFGDGGTAAGRAPTHAWAATGPFTVTLTVTDARGGSATVTSTATVTAASDRAPPRVTVLGPAEVLPGTQVTLTAQVNDASPISRVTFEMIPQPGSGQAGGGTTHDTQPPFERTIDVPAVAASGATITVRATAEDAHDNVGQAQLVMIITAQPDGEAPVVTLNLPQEAAAGRSVRFTADAADNAGVRSLTFLVDDGEVANDSEPPFDVTYLVPAGAPAGSILRIVARAADFTGNEAEASGAVTVVAAPDDAAPSVTLSVPPGVNPGASFSASAAATDNTGIAIVEFRVDGVLVASPTSPPFEVDVAVPAGAAPGALVRIDARVVDFAGNEASAVAHVRVAVATTDGEGLILGEVYDDVTGLPLAGAQVRLTGRDAQGAPYAAAAETSARGAYMLRGRPGTGILTISKSGWTGAERALAIAAGIAQSAIDARLSAYGASQDVSPALGATLASGGLQVTIPPGALGEAATLQASSLSPQGLRGLLPPGWTPLAAFDIAPAGRPLNGAEARTPLLEGVPPGRVLHLIRWDEIASSWRAVTSRPAPESGPVAGELPMTGQFAWILGDIQPAPPPDPAPGDLLSGVAVSSIPVDAAAAVTPQPRVLFYEPGVRSDVRTELPSAAPLTSGTRLQAVIQETYRFTSGGSLQLDPFVQDLFFHQVPAAPVRLSASYPVSPSLVFEALTLQEGVIGVNVHEPSVDSAPVIDAAGGTITAPGGERLEIPAGAVSTLAAAELHTLAAVDLGVVLPEGLTFMGGVVVSLAGAQLARSGTLSVPRPEGLDAGAAVLLVRVHDVGGATRLLFVGVGRVEADRVTSVFELPRNRIALEGIVAGGRYAFLAASSGAAYAFGHVVGGAGAPFAGALVSSDTLIVAALSQLTGAYVVAIRPASSLVTALDVVTSDSGAIRVSPSAPGDELAIDVRLEAQAPAVIGITPADGARHVPPSSPIVVRFSEPIDAASLGAQDAISLAGPGGVQPGTLALTDGNTTLTFRPATELANGAGYTFTVSSVTDMSGHSLAAPFSVRFTSLDTLPPPTPPAGSVTASIPGGDGFTTVTATQGTAGAHETVTVENVTTQTSTPVLVDPNGGFGVRVAAGIADRLRIVITDQSGNQTVVALGRFRQTNANGSVSASVTAEGGHIDGPGGTAVDVAPGTFPDGAVVTIKPVAEADFPLALTAEQQTVFNYAGGFEIDFGGVTPTRYVNVSVPASEGDTADDQWTVSQVGEFGGETVLNVVDTAKLVDGRVTTSSPPCPGITGAGVFGVHRSNQPLGLAYGTLAPGRRVTAGVSGVTPSGSPLAMPYGAHVSGHGPICIPLVSSRITIGDNAVQIRVPFSEILAGDKAVRIQNVRTSVKRVFMRDDLAYPITVVGWLDDRFEVSVIGPGGTRTVPFTLQPGLPAGQGLDTVTIVVSARAITPQGTQVVIRNTSKPPTDPFAEFRIPTATLKLALTVAGGENDGYSVEARPSGRVLTFDPPTSANGLGNLVLRAIPGAFSPTQDEIDEFLLQNPGAPVPPRARTEVVLVDKTTTNAGQISNQRVPGLTVNGIRAGGVAFGFDGDPLHDFAVQVLYATGLPEHEDIRTSRILVHDARGQTVQAIVVPSPPPDDPKELEFVEDSTAPEVVTGVEKLRDIDPSGWVTIEFSEPMWEDIASFLSVDDENGQLVEGRFHISPDNLTATFVPAHGLEFGKAYVVHLTGVKDAGWNEVNVSSLRFTTLSPRRISSLATGPLSPALPLQYGLRDLAVHRTPGPPPETTIVAVTDSQLFHRLVTIDVTNEAQPRKKGFAFGGALKERVLLFPVAGLLAGGNQVPPAGGTECPPAPGTSFTGDVALTATTNTLFSFVQFFDLTDTTKPCLMGGKFLTANPATVSNFDSKGTVHAVGSAKGVAALRHADGYTVYTAVTQVGITATDMGLNTPEALPANRERDELLPGHYVDVAVAGTHLVALNAGLETLEIVDPNLTALTAIDLPDRPLRVTYVPGLPFDSDRDGTVESHERIHAAFVACYRTVVVVDLTQVLNPVIVGRIPIPVVGSRVVDIDVDPGKMRLYVGARGWIFIVDLTRAGAMQLIDANGDQIDDRIVWRTSVTDRVEGLVIDAVSNHLYVATDRGLDVYRVAPPNLTGVARFTHFGNKGGAFTPSGIDYGSEKDKPIRGALVELRQGVGVLQSTYTDGTGYYAFDAPVGSTVEVVVSASLGPTGQETRVVDNATAGEPIWEVSSGPFVMPASVRKAVNASTIWDDTRPSFFSPPHLGSYDKREGAAFAILDAVYQAQQKVRHADSSVSFHPLTIGWSPINENSDVLKPDLGLIDTAYFKPQAPAHPGRIYLRGVEHVDTDEYDPSVILHEWGHYFVDRFSRDDTVAGTHTTADTRLDARVAFSEGFATALGGLLNEDANVGRIYIDTSGVRQVNTGVFNNLEDNTHASEGPYSEFNVMRLLWDLYDSTPGEDLTPATKDSISVPFDRIYRVMRHEQRTARAFTSTFSFLHHLSEAYLSDPALQSTYPKIAALTESKNVHTVKLDEFGFTELLEVNTIKVGPEYNVLQLGVERIVFNTGPFVGSQLAPSTTYDYNAAGNKLFESVFFKVDIPAAGNYLVTVTPIDAVAVELRRENVGYRYMVGQNVVHPFSFEQGLRSVSVRTFDAGGAPASGKFKIKIVAQ